MLMTERERLAGEIQALAEKHGRNHTALIPMVQEIKRRYNKNEIRASCAERLEPRAHTG